ncbi:hypothetical protein [Streptomyces sp. NPDC089799]|uniref:hypothetical protein n=1 Tax=Streptomyces sp. NPDC089799 TaxID=3155066 RepID=UPI0034406A7D
MTTPPAVPGPGPAPADGTDGTADSATGTTAPADTAASAATATAAPTIAPTGATAPADTASTAAGAPAPARRRWARRPPALLAVAAFLAVLAALLAGLSPATPYGDRLTARQPAAGPEGAAYEVPHGRPAYRLALDRDAVHAYAPDGTRPAWTYAREGRRPVAVRSAPGHAFTLWDDGMVTDTVRRAGTGDPVVRWHRTAPGAGTEGSLASLGADGRMLVVVTPARALGYRAEDGDLRWIVTARKGCAFRPGEAPPTVDRLLLLAQDCDDPDMPWTLRTVAVGEQGRIKPAQDRRPEK